MRALASRPDADVALFPHRLDVARKRVTFVRVERAVLRELSFLDGREKFWGGEPIEFQWEDVQAEFPVGDTSSRYVFHVGFCGSSLLSRLLDVVGASLVLREPRILTDLAAHKAALDRSATSDPRVDEALGHARILLDRRWEPFEAVVVKPSNWINNLVPRLCKDTNTMRPLFLTMDRRAYLRAVWRGGSARVAFAARAAVHFSDAREEWSQVVATVLHETADTSDTLAVLAALSQRFQEELFHTACERGDWPTDRWMTLEEIRGKPEHALSRAAAILGLPSPCYDPLAASAVMHSKHPGTIFSDGRETEVDGAVEEQHGPRFDRALVRVDELLPARTRP